MDASELIVRHLATILSVAAIAALAPFERLAPRVVRARDTSRRLAALAVLAAASVLASDFFNAALLDDLIALYRHAQIFSISKMSWPPAVIFVVSFLLVDLANYAVHVLFHKVGLFWRMHAIHHADENVSAPTALLHHPFETLAHACVGLFVYVTLGVPIIVVTIYALAASLHSVFSHANIRIAPSVERWLRLVLITPDFHRTHHSIEMAEGNSNFGSVFPFWDRLFGTYVAHPARTEASLVMGLPATEKPAAFAAGALLLHPLVFRRK